MCTVKILRNTNFTKSGFLDLRDVAEHPVEIRQLESRILKYSDILLEKSGGGPAQPVGRVAIFNIGDSKYSYSNFTARIRVIYKKAEPFYVWHCLNYLYQKGVTEKLQKQTSGIRNLDNTAYQRLQIPLPPIGVQKEIVAEIEGYQKVIDGARAVIENYRPHIPINSDWPILELGEIAKPEYGFTEKASDKDDVRFIRITDISEKGMLRKSEPKFITLTTESQNYLLRRGDILVARTGATYGKTMIFQEEYPAVFASFLIRLRFPEDCVHPSYYWIFSQSELYWNQAKALMTGGGQPQFNGNALRKVKIPLPPLNIQQAIVAEIEAEQELVNGNRELTERFEKKIQTTLSRIWGVEELEG